MPYTYEELKTKTVAELREIAKGLDQEAIQGYTQLNKEHLLVAVCKTLNIDMHAHHHHHSAGDELAKMKQSIKVLKKQRDEALAAHDHKSLKRVRTRMRRLKKRVSNA